MPAGSESQKPQKIVPVRGTQITGTQDVIPSLTPRNRYATTARRFSRFPRKIDPKRQRRGVDCGTIAPLRLAMLQPQNRRSSCAHEHLSFANTCRTMGFTENTAIRFLFSFWRNLCFLEFANSLKMPDGSFSIIGNVFPCSGFNLGVLFRMRRTSSSWWDTSLVHCNPGERGTRFSRSCSIFIWKVAALNSKRNLETFIKWVIICVRTFFLYSGSPEELQNYRVLHFQF